MKNWKNIGLIATVIIIILIPIAGIKFKTEQLYRKDSSEPSFVGGDKCMHCHETEFNLWKDSHHAKAMAHTTDTTVLGDFNNAEFIENGISHKFYKRDGEFFVFTKGVDGKMEEYKISHTFGYTPLQQYLIPFEKGKYQCLPIAWDTEKSRWFNMGAMVYHEEELKPDDWLYWTNQAQNWNGMCAECHSTNLDKNYYHETDSFHTTWSEINVSCEACHGPSSKHVEWANWPEAKQDETENYGLIAKTSGIDNEQYVNLCARCHTRRSQLGDFDHEFHDLLDKMVPTLLHDDYYADGQILDEDYVFGSFVQSKMYHTDIKCNDCHNVHSGNRHLEGNNLCFTCHKSDYYGTAKHHFHKVEGESGEPYYIGGTEVATGEGASCVNCHMPATIYMGNDSRNDHSIRIPRPDLSKKIGTPNACNMCHTDKSNDWSIRYVEEWYGKKDRPHYGTAIAAGRKGELASLNEIKALIRDVLSPLIVRATALELLANYSDTGATKVIQEALDAPESMLRFSAVRIYSNNIAEEYIKDLSPLLTDPVKAVRMETGLKFSYLPAEMIPEEHKESFKKALQEFREQNEYMADFPGGRANLGLMYNNIGKTQDAIKQYEAAIKIDKQYTPAIANIALLYNQVGRNSDAEKVYKELIKNNPNVSGIHYSLGLLLVEEKKFDEGIKYLEIASEKDPENSRINYNLGLLYSQLNQLNKAEKQLLLAIKKESENYDYQYALAYFYVNTAQYSNAQKRLNKLLTIYPNDQNIIQLNRHLQTKNQ